MQQSAATTVSTRLVRAAAAATLGLAVVFVPVRGIGQQPASVQPTVRLPGLPPLSAVPTIRQPNDEKVKEEAPELSLGECIAIAIERQPSLKAVRGSQRATDAGHTAIGNIRGLAEILSPDLPIRRQQSDRGVIAAAADVQKLHNEVVHDVTRLYYSVVYAKQQEILAHDVVAQVEQFVDIAKTLLKSPTPGEMTQAKLDAMIIGMAKVKKLQGKAKAGVRLAEAGLREVMGVADGSLKFHVLDKELPVMSQNVPLTKDQIVAMALERRPELALAAAAADAFRLEVYAQGQMRFRRAVPTLASASDIHSRMLPIGSRDPNQHYRPEPIAPEMPPQVVGSKADRVARTMEYSHRADAAYEKARDLMILEAETTFIDFDEAAKNVVIKKEGFKASTDLMERIREGFDNPKAAKEQLLLGYGQAAEAQADYVQAVFQYLLEMAALERVTAGGVRPQFPGR